MKASNFFGSPVRAGAIFALALAFALESANAGEAKDISKQISELRDTIRTAEVFLVPRGVALREALGERDVVRIACRHANFATSPADVGSLIDVLVNAKLMGIPADKEGYDARIVVYLQGTSRLFTLVLSQDYDNAHARGVFRREGNPSLTTHVEATNGIERDLGIWAAQHESLKTNRCR